MKKFTFFIIFFIIHYSLFITHCSAQWLQITLPVSGGVYQMQFINQNTGWVVVSQSGYGYIMLRTTNQGTNWSVIYSDSSKVGKFQFINDTLGYAMGYSSQGYHLMSKTTNSGYNWTVMQNTEDILNGFYMINADTGWVNAFSVPTTYTLRTTNGFQTMEQISTGGGGTPATLYFFKEKYSGEYCGYVLGAGILSKTTNSGYNWEQINLGSIGDISYFSFLNKDTGWIVIPYSIQSSRIYYTYNGGLNWTLQFLTNTQGDFGYIQAVNKSKIWCGKNYNNRILITTNGGVSWGYQTSPINNNGGLYFYDTLLGFAWSNQIVRTTNGGGVINSTEKISSNISTSFYLKQNYPNPFNSSTTIFFEIPKSSIISMIIYDILGKEVIRIINSKEMNQGYYKSNINFSNYDLSSGLYFYKLIAIDKGTGKIFQFAKKMIYNK
jgi:photosystem II stability/assembly factor-like uncharacterized protein